MKVNFAKNDGLAPAIIQDARTGTVLMLGYMNAEALAKTQAEGRVTFFSRAKQRLWTKGETSGNFLHVQEIRADCDGDTLLIRAIPAGPVCHTGAETCFAEANEARGLAFLDALAAVIRDRREHPDADSYTGSLFGEGTRKIAQKVGEEAVELVIEAMDIRDNRFREEAADLLFHFLVLLENRNTTLNEIIAVLQQRHHK